MRNYRASALLAKVLVCGALVASTVAVTAPSSDAGQRPTGNGGVRGVR